MPIEVQTPYQIMGALDVMALIKTSDLVQVATAVRSEGVWTITADGVPAVTANTRADAITALKEQTMASLNVPHCAAFLPHGIAEMP